MLETVMQLGGRFCGMYFTPEDKDIIKLGFYGKEKLPLRMYLVPDLTDVYLGFK